MKNKWQFYGMIWNPRIGAGMLMDLVSPLFPSPFVFIVCIGILSRSFTTGEEAVKAYDIAAIKFRGVNAVTWRASATAEATKSSLPVGASKHVKLSLEAESNQSSSKCICRIKIEKEKLEKLARKGPNPEEKPPPTAVESGSVSGAKDTSHTSKSGVSTDKHRNYAVIAGVSTYKHRNCTVLVGIVTVLGVLGWYLKSNKRRGPRLGDLLVITVA